MRKIALILAFAPVLLFAPPARATHQERLHGISLDPDTLTIEVVSSGCTAAEDFAFRIWRSGRRALVTVVRLRPDTCEAVSRVIALTFDRPDIGLAGIDELRIRNRFSGLL